MDCWECGQRFCSVERLVSHYKSHKVSATCHICKVTFRRITSLLTHMDNVHKPHCMRCKQCFWNVGELNKHLESQCVDSVLSESHLSQHILNGDNFKKASRPPPKDVQRNDAFFHVAEDHSYALSFKHDLDIQQLNAQQSPDIESKPLESCAIKQERPETPDNTIAYTVGEANDPCQTGYTSDLSNSEHDAQMSDDDKTHLTDSTDTTSFGSNDPESDIDSNSSGYSHSSPFTPLSQIIPATHPSADTSMCTTCGKGPFRNVKVHLRFCVCKKENLQCSVCKQSFGSKQSLRNHKLVLHSCDTCGQVFAYLNSYLHHQCPKGNYSTVMFCSKLMPKACHICKAFFNSEQSLLKHVVQAHSTLVRISFNIHDQVSPVVCNTAAQSSTSSSGHILVSSHGLETTKRKSSAVQTAGGSLSSVVKSNLPPSPSPSHSALVPLTPKLVNSAPNEFAEDVLCGNTISRAASKRNTSDPQVTVMRQKNAPSPCSPVKLPHAPSRTNRAINQKTKQLVGGVNKSAATGSVSPTMPALNILAVFKNVSQEVALMKRMNTSWRSKAPYPCRQCGAISRQPSLIISHRYLHRGRRTHQCQCGRAFKHRLHLLRHCVQHAEAASYICVSCGETFTGATLLAEHMNGRLRKGRSAGCSWKVRVRRKCQMPFSCDCGQLFVRPSAYIWHQIKNRPLK